MCLILIKVFSVSHTSAFTTFDADYDLFFYLWDRFAAKAGLDEAEDMNYSIGDDAPEE